MMYYNNYGGNFSEGIREGIKNSFRKGSSLTRLIYINCGIFLALKLIYIMMLLLGKGEEFYPTLLEWIGVPADPEYLLSRPWTIFTYMFTQFDFLHLLFNMFGRILESVWGTQRFLIFYFVCGIGAGLLNSAVGWLEIHRLMEQYYAFQNAPSPALLAQLVERQLGHPAQWVWEVVDNWTNNPDSQQYIVAGKQLFRQIVELKVNVPMIGASGAIFGILLAFGMLFPNTELYLMFIPIPIKAKYFVLGYGLLELFLGMQNSATDNVAHFAHLGGMLFGFFMVKYWSKNRRRFY